MGSGRKLGMGVLRIMVGALAVVAVVALANRCTGTDTSRVRTAVAQARYANGMRSDPFEGLLIEQVGSSDDQLVKGGYRTCDDIEDRGMDKIAEGGGRTTRHCFPKLRSLRRASTCARSIETKCGTSSMIIRGASSERAAFTTLGTCGHRCAGWSTEACPWTRRSTMAHPHDAGPTAPHVGSRCSAAASSSPPTARVRKNLQFTDVNTCASLPIRPPPSQPPTLRTAWPSEPSGTEPTRNRTVGVAVGCGNHGESPD